MHCCLALLPCHPERSEGSRNLPLCHAQRGISLFSGSEESLQLFLELLQLPEHLGLYRVSGQPFRQLLDPILQNSDPLLNGFLRHCKPSFLDDKLVLLAQVGPLQQIDEIKDQPEFFFVALAQPAQQSLHLRFQKESPDFGA